MEAAPYSITTDSSDNIHGSHHINISADRLFPEWRYLAPSLNLADTGWNSVAPVEYFVTPYPEVPERIVTIKDTNSLVFTIKAPGLKFKQMLATVAIPYVRQGKTQKIEVPFPFNKDSRDSLRGKFKLPQVLCDIFLTPRLPIGAYIGVLQIQDTLFSPGYPDIAPATTTLLNVRNNVRFRQQIPITNIMNNWPDSMFINQQITVPIGTQVLAENQPPVTYQDSLDYNKNMGRMIIRAASTVRTNIMLGWKVDSTAKLDLGIGSFQVSKSLKSFNRLENALAYLNMKFDNHSNVYMNLYALAAPAPRMRMLNNMPIDSVLLLIGDTAKAHQRGYFDILGPRGIRIPKRSEKDTSNIVLQQWEIDTMLKYDSCGWRWEASFLPMGADTLRDKDYVFIQSYVHLEGVNNMDSLINQK